MLLKVRLFSMIIIALAIVTINFAGEAFFNRQKCDVQVFFNLSFAPTVALSTMITHTLYLTSSKCCCIYIKSILKEWRMEKQTKYKVSLFETRFKTNLSVPRCA